MVTFEGTAKTAWDVFVSAKGAPAGLQVANLIHPTYPERAGGKNAEQAANTKKMLAQWNASGLDALFGAVTPDKPTSTLVPYGEALLETAYSKMRTDCVGTPMAGCA